MKNILLIALGTFGLLLIPFFGHWPWTISDFVIAGVLIFGVGTILNVVLTRFGKYRLLIAGIVVLLFFWLWVELAVGLFTNWGS